MLVKIIRHNIQIYWLPEITEYYLNLTDKEIHENLLEVLKKYTEVGILRYFNEYLKGGRSFIIN